jgi:hypothetical protein
MVSAALESRRISGRLGFRASRGFGRHEDWIQIAALDDQGQIRFMQEYQDLMGDLGREAKAFVGHLLALWYDPFQHMLDHGSGEATCTQDQPGQFDRNPLDEPQDVVESWSVEWSRNGTHHQPAQQAGAGLGLSAEWYRDVLRTKLVSLRLPRRLLLEYKGRSDALSDVPGNGLRFVEE